MLNVNASLPPTPLSARGPASFMPDFFTPTRQPPNVVAAQAAAKPGIFYSLKYHSHAAFEESADFPRYRNELYAALQFLGDFYQQQCTSDAEVVAARLIKLYHHRFPDTFFGEYDPLRKFNGYEYLIDGHGKQSLEHICTMIRDERIPIEKKIAAIRNLSEGLDVCAPGVVSHLVAVERDLALSSAGIRVALWKVKEKITEAIIQQEVYEQYSGTSNYKLNEIHYVNATWNHSASTIGLIRKTDPHAIGVKTEFMEACLHKVRRAMTPERLATAIAEECLGLFTSQLAARGHPLSGHCTPRINEDFQEVLQNVQQHYADLNLHAFLRLDNGDTRYRVRADPSLIALDLLRSMRTENLLTEASVAANQGEWIDSDGTRHALLTFGASLAWRADRMNTPSGTSDWSLDTEVEQLTMHDLRAWWEACGSEDKILPGVFPTEALNAALRQAVDGADPADIDNLPSSWLTDLENLFVVLPRMTDKAADQCLQASLPYFKEQLSAKACAGLIDRAMGKSTAILMLAQSRYRNPWELLLEPRGAGSGTRLQYWMATDNGAAIDALLQTVDGRCYLDTGTHATDREVFEALRGLQSKPALNVAMAAGNAKATGAWCRLVSMPGVMNRLGKYLAELLEAKDAEGATALGRALALNRAKPIEEVHDLLTNAAVAAQIGNAMPGLLKAPLKADVPGLLSAMEDGYAEGIQVYYAMLVAPAILPHIVSALPDLVRACAPKRSLLGLKGAETTGLVQAMKYGRTNAIRAFHVMVVDPRILPRIVKILPTLATGTGRDDKGCLALALEYGRAGAIREFHDMVANPLITPHIKDVLHKVLLAHTPRSLGIALEKGWADAIKELHAFLVDPAIRRSLVHSIRKLLAAPGRDGTPGLSWALRNNQASAIEAYGNMLTDPVLLPLVRHDLSRLIRRVLNDMEKLPDASGESKLLPVMRASQSQALTALRGMVMRPEISVRLDEETAKRLTTLEADPAAALGV